MHPMRAGNLREGNKGDDGMFFVFNISVDRANQRSRLLSAEPTNCKVAQSACKGRGSTSSMFASQRL